MSTIEDGALHYRAMFLENRAVMLLINPNDGTIRDASVGACQYYGYSLSELKAMNVSDINTKSKSEVAAKMRQAKKETENYFHFQHRLADGEIRDVEVYSNPISLEGQKFLCSVIHDITERKQAEEALRRSEETNRAIIETSKDWIWAFDLDGNHTYSNPAVETILGYTPDEMVGKHSLDFVHDDDREFLRFNIENWIRSQQGWSNLVIRWRHKHGGYRYLESNAVPSFNADNKLVGFRGVDRDVTERKRMEDSLRESEEKYQLAMESVQDGLWDWDVTTGSVYYSPAWSHIIGEEHVKNDYSSWETRIHPDDKDRVLSTLQSHLSGETEAWKEEHRLINVDGTWTWVLGRGRVVERDGDGKPLRMVGTMTDISERKQIEEKLEYLAAHDSLTELYNRKELKQRLRVELPRTARYNHALSMFLLDLDHFKLINDTYGHQAGDAVLRGIAKILEGCIRKTDYAARYGGEEFVIVLPETPLAEAEDLAERLRINIEEHAITIAVDGGKEINLTASIGVSTIPEHGESMDDLFNAADSAMYAAKDAGRNCIRVAENID